MHGFHFERVHGFVNGVAIPEGDEMSACVCRGFPLPIGAGNTCEEHGCVETNATSALRLVAGTYFASLLSGERGRLVEPDSSFACAADEYLVVASKYDPLSGECFKPGAHEYQEGNILFLCLCLGTIVKLFISNSPRMLGCLYWR